MHELMLLITQSLPCIQCSFGTAYLISKDSKYIHYLINCKNDNQLYPAIDADQLMLITGRYTSLKLFSGREINVLYETPGCIEEEFAKRTFEEGTWIYLKSLVADNNFKDIDFINNDSPLIHSVNAIITLAKNVANKLKNDIK